MDREDKIIMLACVVLMFVLVFALMSFAAFFQYTAQKAQCEKLDGYDLVTEFRKESALGYSCYIKMDDGIWIQANDFDITAIKTPATKR